MVLNTVNLEALSPRPSIKPFTRSTQAFILREIQNGDFATVGIVRDHLLAHQYSRHIAVGSDDGLHQILIFLTTGVSTLITGMPAA